MTELSIGEVAEKSNLAASAIRYYESIGLLEQPKRLAGRRRYEASVLQRLSLIRLAREIGFSLDDVQILMNGFPEGTSPDERWQALVPQKLDELDRLSAKIESMRRTLRQTLQCGCLTLDQCVGGLENGMPRLNCGDISLRTMG